SNSSGAVQWPSSGSQGSKSSAKSGQRPSRPRRTPAKSANGKNSAKALKRHRSKRAEIMRRLGVTSEQLAVQVQIDLLLRQNGVTPLRLVQILRCDDQPEAHAFVGLWDTLTPEYRSLAGVEALALGAGMTPRRLWEIFCGAALVQSQ